MSVQVAQHAPAHPPKRSVWSVGLALVEMTKARLSSLVLVTTAAGYVLALPEGATVWTALFASTLIGTALAAFGANALNQCLECPFDREMERTRGRPLPSGRVGMPLAIVWSLALLLGGTGLLVAFSEPLAGLLALVVGVLYVGAYTPLKRRTSLSTLIGAVCGAIPPMIGWVAANGGQLEVGAWVLFGILFVWQIPHFLAIDWFHREDYEAGGFLMVSRVDGTGRFGAYLTVIYSLALIPITLLATPLGLGGWLYFAGAISLGVGLLLLSIGLWTTRTRAAARRLFLGSIIYLPLLLGLLVIDPVLL